MKTTLPLLAAAATLATAPLALAQVTFDFETSGQLTNNFRSIMATNGVSITETSNGPGNDFINFDGTNSILPGGNGNTAFVLLYDSTPGDATVATQSSIPVSTQPITVSFDFRVAVANASVGVFLADATNVNNHILALFNVDNSGTTDRFRFFKDGTISPNSGSVGTQVGGNTDRTSTAAVGSWSNFSVTLTTSGTTPTLAVTAGGQSISSGFAAGDIDWTNTVIALRIFDNSTNLAGNGVDIDNVIVPVPEPSAFAALAGLGALGMANLRRRARG